MIRENGQISPDSFSENLNIDQSSVERPIQRIKYLRKQIQSSQFFFPATRDIIQKTQNIEQILKPMEELPQSVQFKKRRIKNYLYLKCKYCTSRFSYLIEKKDNDFYTLVRYDNRHIHTRTKKEQQVQFKRMIESNEQIYSPQQVRNLIMSTLGLSKRRYYYLLSKLYNNKSFHEIIQQLLSQQWQVFHQFNSEDDQIPQLFFAMSPEMKSWAFQYADSIAIDVTYNLMTSQKTHKNVGVYFITGFDSNFRILPLAFGLLLKQTTQNFIKIFSSFFSIIKWSGMVIISDEQLTIKNALIQLKQNGIFRGTHLYDCFHILRSLNKKLSNERDFELCHRIIMSKSKNTCQQSISQLKKSKTMSKTNLQGLLTNIQKYSYSLAEPFFIGIVNSSNRAEKMNDLIKRYIPYQVHFSRFFINIRKLIRAREKARVTIIENIKYEKKFQDDGIQKVRLAVEKKVFNAFLSNYMMAARIKSGRVSFNKINDYQINNQDCECQNSIKQGIPCQHRIKYIWENSQYNYLNYFNKRWRINTNLSVGKRMSGRPKNSRKNK